jgi:outer membrane receptor protein involved in Fe transport
VRLGATVFYNDFEDLIQTVLVDPANFCFQAQNVGRARTRGVEVEASVTPLTGLLLSLAYTYTDTEDLETGDPLRRFAPNRWALGASYEPLRGLSLSAEVQIVSSQFEAPGLPRNAGYTVVNVAGQYRLPWRWGVLRDMTVHLRIKNLFNEDYAEVLGFPALGTHVVAGLRATF